MALEIFSIKRANSQCKAANVVASSSIKEQESANFKLAEANVTLMEKQEALEKQKWQLAEANLKMLELQEELLNAQHKSEKLLKNILPERVAHELKEYGKSVPECFEHVSVFFSDIVDFTQNAAKMEPREVISELSTIFTVFDRIFIKNGCERIKTIGDAYLGVSGMPTADDNHSENIINAAIEVVEYLNERNRTAKFKWQIRVGIHSGKVVGGIVGTEKYIYDIFGDTINIAARMERHSEPMKINISDTTYQLLSGKFNFVKRDLTEVKGKGVLQMYFLENQR
ncbi:MAG: adenylate/guanylate cyclase domain-containing protein [Victivallaceae bacterium]|nr:adenylate/guanylate cyclase domain-containing protein [Victivallaceae bacterium]